MRARGQVAADRRDGVPIDEHIRVGHIAERRIEGQHVSTPNQSGSIAKNGSADHGSLLRSFLSRLLNAEAAGYREFTALPGRRR
jgi:hypothetical protein